MKKGKIMKHSNKAKIGDTIRAYDFMPMAGRGDAYVEGVVVDVNNRENGYNAYKIKVIADKFIGDVETEESQDNRIGQIIFVPHQISFMEFDFRVINMRSI
jgi:hypothetical protein